MPGSGCSSAVIPQNTTCAQGRCSLFLLALLPALTNVFGEGEQDLALLPSILPLQLQAESGAWLYQRVKNTSVQERSCPSGRPKEILSPHLISRKKILLTKKKKKKNLKQAGSHLSTATHRCSGEQLVLHKASLLVECKQGLRDGNASPSPGTRCPPCCRAR